MKQTHTHIPSDFRHLFRGGVIRLFHWHETLRSTWHHTPKPIRLGLLIVSIWLAFGSFFIVPICYDEIYNYMFFGRRLFPFILTDYHAPNNHVLYSLLSGLVSPRFLVYDIWPALYRIGNVLTGVGFVYLLSTLFKNKLGYKWAFAVALGILLASPLSLSYLFVARGYLLGALLLCFSLWKSLEDPELSALLAGLSIYCVSSFIFYLPLPALAYLCFAPKKAFKWGALTLFTFALLYAPIFKTVFISPSGLLSLPNANSINYVLELLNTTTHFDFISMGVLGGSILLGGLLVVVAMSWVRTSYQLNKRDMMVLGACSFLLMSLFIPSFVRNAIGVPILLTTALFVSLNKSRFVPFLALLFVSLGLVRFHYSFISPGKLWSLPGVSEVLAMPLAQHTQSMKNGEITQIYCHGFADLACDLFAPYFDTWGVEIVATMNNTLPGGECALGTVLTKFSQSRISVQLSNGVSGELCF